jgi:RimJ/RimL family protein N-acetyltransferase
MHFEPRLPLPPAPVLETARLRLRPLELRDAPALQRGFDDWQVVRLLHAGIPWPYPADGALANTLESLEKAARGEQLYWVITERGGDDQAIGRIDLKPMVAERDMRGFWLARPWWGRGLMTEAAEAVTGYAFEVLEWPFLYLNNAADNLGSHRVKEKQGAEIVDVAPHAFMDGERMRVTWILRREAWLARRGA